MIDVTLLGTGGMLPLPHRWLSSLLVRCNGRMVLFDCGEGTQIAWRVSGWGFRRLAAICISHTHADHVAGLPGLLHALANAGKTDPLAIYGPPGIEETVWALRTIAPHLPYEVETVALEHGGAFALPNGLTGRVAAGDHALPVLGYRLEIARAPRFEPARAEALDVPQRLWGRLQAGEAVSWPGGTATPGQVTGPAREGLELAFVTDTRPTPALVELARGVDLLVCEGTYGDSADLPKALDNKHMTFAEAATLARDAGAELLWLTHFSQAVENPELFRGNASDIFPRVEVGRAGLSTTLAFKD